jgi:hypothetical protein
LFFDETPAPIIGKTGCYTHVAHYWQQRVFQYNPVIVQQLVKYVKISFILTLCAKYLKGNVFPIYLIWGLEIFLLFTIYFRTGGPVQNKK